MVKAMGDFGRVAITKLGYHSFEPQRQPSDGASKPRTPITSCHPFATVLLRVGTVAYRAVCAEVE